MSRETLVKEIEEFLVNNYPESFAARFNATKDAEALLAKLEKELTSNDQNPNAKPLSNKTT